MPSDENTLVFTKADTLATPPNAHYSVTTSFIFQLANGTIFYHRFFAFPKTIHVIHEGKEIVAQLPNDNDCFGVHGNALYFESLSKFYKASISSAESAISITFLRSLLEGEDVHNGALCSRKRNGKRFIYRMCDHPETDGIEIPAEAENMEGLVLSAIVGDKILYRHVNPELQEPVARKLGERAIVVELPFSDCPSLLAHTSSQFIYFIDGVKLHTLDLEKFEFLAPLTLGVSVLSFGGVHNGVITILCGEEASSNWIATALLPDAYVAKPSIEHAVDDMAI